MPNESRPFLKQTKTHSKPISLLPSLITSLFISLYLPPSLWTTFNKLIFFCFHFVWICVNVHTTDHSAHTPNPVWCEKFIQCCWLCPFPIKLFRTIIAYIFKQFLWSHSWIEMESIFEIEFYLSKASAPFAILLFSSAKAAGLLKASTHYVCLCVCDLRRKCENAVFVSVVFALVHF